MPELAALALTVTLGTAGAPLDDTWTVYHDWRMKSANMIDVGYMPTVWRNLCTEGECIGDVLANDPYPEELRLLQVLNEPDLLGGGVAYWATRYTDAYREIKARAAGPTLVGGISLYWCDAEWLRKFLAELPDDVHIQWLGVHTYADWLTVTRYIQAAQAMLGYGVPVYVTEAGHLGAQRPGEALAYMGDLAAWIAENPSLGVRRVYWFVTWDPPLPDYEGWNSWASGTVLYNGDGTLTTVGEAWRVPEIAGTVYWPMVGRIGEE